MTARTDHLDAKTRDLLDAPLRTRVQSILADRFVYHDRVNALMDECDYLMLCPQGLRPQGLLVCGSSGSGKTALAASLVRRYASAPPTERDAATRPVLSISMVNARDANEIHRRLLHELGCPDPSRYTVDQRRGMTFSLARVAQVRMLIVDEVQDLLHITPRQRALALLGIKDVMNSLLVPTVALGTPEARQAMQSDQHLNARFAFRQLPRWACDDYLRHFLEAFESTLPLRERSRLGSLEFRRLILAETGGVMATMVSRLKIAAALAVEYGTERISREVFLRGEYDFPTGAPRQTSLR